MISEHVHDQVTCICPALYGMCEVMPSQVSGVSFDCSGYNPEARSVWRPWQDIASSVFPPSRSRGPQEDTAARYALDGGDRQRSGDGWWSKANIVYVLGGWIPPLHWAARLTSHSTWRARRSSRPLRASATHFLQALPACQPRQIYIPACIAVVHWPPLLLLLASPFCDPCHTGRVEPRKFPNRAIYDQVASLLPPRLTPEPQRQAQATLTANVLLISRSDTARTFPRPWLN